jgi:hypothetical protein
MQKLFNLFNIKQLNYLRNTNHKIFCISIQRTGTTSVGQFFKHFNFKVADWSVSYRNQWSYLWYQGNYEAIFSSKDFLLNQVFEDDPWWCPEFYKVLFHRFPKSRFILFTRDANQWFKSMMNHSNGKTLGNTKIHCKIYRREEEFYKLLENEPNFIPRDAEIDNLMSLKEWEEQYKKIYLLHNKEVKIFFKKHDQKSLFVSDLNDTYKWDNLADFIKINIPKNFDIHVNKS